MKPIAVSHESLEVELVGAGGGTARSCSRKLRSLPNRVQTACPSCAVRRWSVEPVRIDYTRTLVPNSRRTVWFAVLSTASVL